MGGLAGCGAADETAVVASGATAGAGTTGASTICCRAIS